MKVVLEDIKRFVKQGKDGRDYISVCIRVDGRQHYGFDKVVRGFSESWQPGDEVDVEFFEKQSPDGSRVFNNFKVLTQNDKISARLDDIERRLSALEGNGSYEEPPF